MAVTDIADFFPRIYHHRLENILKAVARSQRATDAANALMRRLLLNVASRDSYGLPVGPLASSVLAEAILIDVDAALSDEGFDFVRWFDDYTFFCRNATEAQQALFFLAEWLHHHHGLTLNPAKTKILAKASFLRGIANDFEQRMKARSAELSAFWAVDFYGTAIDLEPEQRAELESLDLASMLREALKRRRSKGGVDYEFAAFILGRLSGGSVFTTEQAMKLAEVVIKHIPHLYPIIDSVAAFFVSLEGFSKRHYERVAKALLKPFGRKPAPPDFVAMWILSIFAASSQWNHAQTLRTIYSGATSPIVRRYAALALAANGTRSHALTTRGDLGGAKPLVRTAILAAWHKLGDDERKHWMIADGISDPLEKAI